MNKYSRSHLSDPVLLRDLVAHLAQERADTAVVLADLAEVDARRLYVSAGYPSMRAYCQHEFHLSEDATSKRIQAARAAHRFPAIFTALAEGRLHLSAVVLLAPYLTSENVEELLAAASQKTKAEIAQLLAEWSPRLDMPSLVQPIAPTLPAEALGSSPMGAKPLDTDPVAAPASRSVAAEQHAPGHVGTVPRSKVEPLSPQRWAMQVTFGQSTYDTLRYVQALLSHQVPSGDLEKVVDGAFKAYARELEKRKFAATDRPRRGRRSTNKRHIPAAVKGTVWQRDGGRCTFVSDAGRRCAARHALEFDHIEPVARGGRATVGNMRLRCRAHNQYEAERAFGADFMRRKREKAQRTAAERRAEKGEAGRPKEEARHAAAQAQRADASKRAQSEVVSCLRTLGMRTDESRHAVALCETIPDAPLEERVRLALRNIRPRAYSQGRLASVGIGA